MPEVYECRHVTVSAISIVEPCKTSTSWWISGPQAQRAERTSSRTRRKARQLALDRHRRGARSAGGCGDGAFDAQRVGGRRLPAGPLAGDRKWALLRPELSLRVSAAGLSPGFSPGGAAHPIEPCRCSCRLHRPARPRAVAVARFMAQLVVFDGVDAGRLRAHHDSRFQLSRAPGLLARLLGKRAAPNALI